MTSCSSRRPRRAALAGIVGLCAVSILPGCGSGQSDDTRPRSRPASSSTLPDLIGKPAPTATSDVVGRAFDIGTVVSTALVGGVLTIELDRWTVKGTSDASLAKNGMKIMPHTGDLFTNQNDDRTRTVPVAPGAQVVINTCVRPTDDSDGTDGTDGTGATGGPLGMTSDPQPAEAWLQKPDPKAVLLFTYDSTGRVTRLDTDPRC